MSFIGENLGISEDLDRNLIYKGGEKMNKKYKKPTIRKGKEKRNNFETLKYCTACC